MCLNIGMVTIKAKYAKSLFQQGIGLIGKSQNTTLFFQTHFGIHTFFMKYPIDVVILNSKYEIVTLKENLAPNKFYFWNIKYQNVLELPSGTIIKLNLKIGDKIKLEFIQT